MVYTKSDKSSSLHELTGWVQGPAGVVQDSDAGPGEPTSNGPVHHPILATLTAQRPAIRIPTTTGAASLIGLRELVHGHGKPMGLRLFFNNAASKKQHNIAPSSADPHIWQRSEQLDVIPLDEPTTARSRVYEPLHLVVLSASTAREWQLDAGRVGL